MEFIPTKTMLSRAKGEHWFGIDYTMNIYKGCSHGCIYCDSRSDCYHIEDFDKVRAKKDALVILRKELKGKIKTGFIGTGAMSDPYNPLEAKYGLTRGALEIINEYGFGVCIATKSPLVTRDIDLLKKISKHSPVMVKVTVTTADDELAKKLEPGAQVSSKRFEAMRQLSEAGIFTGILMMPILPFIEDTPENIAQIVRKGAESNIRFIYPAIGMTLRDTQREWYYMKLDKLYPGLKEKYIATYHNEYNCFCSEIKALRKLFVNECKRLGLLYRMEDIITQGKMNEKVEQLSLF